MEATDVAPSASPLKLLLRPSILIVMCDVRKDGDWTELDITEPMALIIWGEHIPSVIPWMYANECRGDRSGRPIHTPQGSLSTAIYKCGKTIMIGPGAFVCDSRLLDRATRPVQCNVQQPFNNHPNNVQQPFKHISHGSLSTPCLNAGKNNHD